MPEEPPVTLRQMEDMFDLLRRTVDAGSESARRIDVLEKASRETFDLLVRLQENQQRLLDGFERQANAQNKLNADLTAIVTRLLAEVEQLKGGHGLVM